ncbi:MAG: Rdx family protein [Chloroflexi bacterium]|nr:Rdx family protein [Chloroflexota bacterium]
MAAWMATEIWHEFGGEAPVTLIPVDGGRLEVTANGETLFDRKAEGGIYPEVKRMRQIQEQIKQRVDAAS